MCVQDLSARPLVGRRAIAVVGRDCSHVCGTSALDGVSFRNVSLCSQAGDVLVIGDSTTSRYLEYLDELIWPLGLNVVYTGDGYGRKGSCANHAPKASGCPSASARRSCFVTTRGLAISRRRG